jgi:hypothetical protein
MNEQEYLESRVKDQIAYYSDKATKAKRWFYFLRVVEITGAASIPFLSGLNTKDNSLGWIIGGVGVIIGVTAGLIGLLKSQENWITFRSTAEQLKHERYIFETSVAPYETSDRFANFVSRIEQMISSENSVWALAHKPKEKK